MIHPRSLRHRFTLIMLTASISFGIAVSGIAYQEIRTALIARTESAADATLQSQVRPLADLVLVEDELGLREALRDLLVANPSWLGVAVEANGEKTPVVVTPQPEGDLSSVTVKAQLLGSSGLDPTRTRRHRDLLSASVGSVTAVVDLTSDIDAAEATVLRLLLAMAVLTVAGMTVASLIGGWLTAPIEQMAAQVRSIRSGKLGLQGPVPATGDEVATLALAINDMSSALQAARRERERQRLAMAEIEKLSAVGTMAAGVAHEVSNPVSGALALVRRARGKDTSPERLARYLSLVEDGLQRALRVLSDLLAYARTEIQGTTETRLVEVAQRSIELAGHRKGRQIIGPRGPDIVVRWPRDPVDQVLSNILLNATRAAHATVELGWRVDGDFVVIEVVDDGDGIPEDLRTKVFDPFFTTQPPGRGTGLGLSVSLSLVTALGGRLELVPRDDGQSGTVARITLPITTSERDHDAA